VGAEGEREWLTRALDRHEAALLRYAASIVGTVAAPDIVQDTFLALCRAERDKVGERVGPWLFVVCKNRAYEWLRAGRRLTPLQDEDVIADSERWRRVETQPALKQVEGLVGRLPSKERQAVILKFSAGLSYKEIAEVMDVSVSHVGVLLHTALGKLRQELAEPPALRAVRSQP
jgi:RNA polymerase sigma factor (sigma-70 family)